jgi:hypothetical protein
MSLLISGDLRLRNLADDPDAGCLHHRCGSADGQALESARKIAINNFVLGCKQDGIWTRSRQAASWLVLGLWLVRWYAAGRDCPDQLTTLFR